ARAKPPRCRNSVHSLIGLLGQGSRFNPTRFLRDRRIGSKLREIAFSTKPHLERVDRIGAGNTHGGKEVTCRLHAEVEHDLAISASAGATPHVDHLTARRIRHDTMLWWMFVRLPSQASWCLPPRHIMTIAGSSPEHLTLTSHVHAE